MCLFSRLINKKNQLKNYVLFSNWLDRILEQELPKNIVAYNFNLYEGSNETYDIQLVGADKFDENDENWACTVYFTSGENICYIKRTKDINNWEKGLIYIKKLVEHYLRDGKYAHTLKKAVAVGVGFVDGNIEIICRTKLIILNITRQSVCFADDMEEHKIEVEVEDNTSYEELFKNIISRNFLPSIIGNDVVWLLTHENIDIISYHTKKGLFKNIFSEHIINKNWKNLHIKYFSPAENFEEYYNNSHNI